MVGASEDETAGPCPGTSVGDSSEEYPGTNVGDSSDEEDVGTSVGDSSDQDFVLWEGTIVGAAGTSVRGSTGGGVCTASEALCGEPPEASEFLDPDPSLLSAIPTCEKHR
jgi:hypothetical protein